MGHLKDFRISPQPHWLLPYSWLAELSNCWWLQNQNTIKNPQKSQTKQKQNPSKQKTNNPNKQPQTNKKTTPRDKHCSVLRHISQMPEWLMLFTLTFSSFQSGLTHTVLYMFTGHLFPVYIRVKINHNSPFFFVFKWKTEAFSMTYFQQERFQMLLPTSQDQHQLYSIHRTYV